MSLLKYYIIMEDENSEEEYQELLNAGTDDYHCEIAEENLKRLFPDIPLEDALRLAQTNEVYSDLLHMVQEAFIKWYGWNPGKIIINRKNQSSIISYAITDADYPMFIHVGTLLDSTMFSFMAVMLKWAKNFDDNLCDHRCFRQLLFIMNEMALMGQLPDEEGKAAILEGVANDLQLRTLVSDCYWAMLLFTVGHEMAHIYQMSTNPDYWLTHRSEAERNADYIGYDILLRLIMEPENQNLKMENYAYLAPMMYMDMFELIFCTDQVLYENIVSAGYHGTPEERKDSLFNQIEDDKYQFDTEAGNTVYQNFLDSYDRYYELLQNYKVACRLDNIVHYEERKEHRHL